MKRLLFVLLFVLAAVPAFAQTATPANSFAFDQVASTLATAQSYAYKLYADGSATGSVVVVTCTGAASPFVCTTPVGAFAPGAHTIRLTSGNAAGESAQSAPFSFTMVIIPATPANIRLQ
jgi:hypothetical protein